MQIHFPKKLLVLSGLFLLLSVGCFLFLYFKTKSNNETSNATSEQWQMEIERRSTLSSLDSLVRKIEPEREELETHFAYSTDIVPFLDTIDRIGAQAGVASDLSSVDVLPDKNGLLVQIKATGAFASVYRFLALLENSPYELEFQSMDLEKENGADDLLEPTAKAKPSAKWTAVFKVKLLSYIP